VYLNGLLRDVTKSQYGKRLPFPAFHLSSNHYAIINLTNPQNSNLQCLLFLNLVFIRNVGFKMKILNYLHVSFIMSLTLYVRFQVLKAASIKFRVFWDVAREVDNFNVTTRRYIPEDSKLTDTISSFPDDRGSTYFWNVGRRLFYTAVHPRIQFWTSYSPPW
jgi:hypothetical protein